MTDRSNAPATSASQTGAAEAPPGRPETHHARDIRGGFFVKLFLMMLVNAFLVFGIMNAVSAASWGVLVGTVAILVVVNWVYFSRRTIPGKYLVPGLIFLLVFQVFVMAYTAYVAFTNYGTSHSITRDQAVERIQEYNERQMPDSPTYQLTVLERDGDIFFGIVDDGVAKIGSAEDALAPVDGATVTGEGAGARIDSVEGYKALGFADLLGLDEDVTKIRVPWSDQASDGSLRTTNGTIGLRNVTALEYDAAAGTMTNVETGVVYTENDHGSFVAPDGTELQPGWRVAVGFENFTRMLTDSKLAKPFGQTMVWTFAFGFLSVLTTFAAGLLLAVTFNNARMRSRAWYRAMLILPYAFPGFLSALIWAGMLNTRFGYINQELLGGADIPWLADPVLAKVTILLVNLWLGFPYMFLISTGALQSIPSDIYEAATIDGAGPFRSFRSLTLPLLLVAVTPLLIASFAFNFNNFSLIYMLTAGGPKFVGNEYGLGSTDILISMVYKIAVEAGGSKDYGLASAMSIVIFLIVGVVSYIGFRKTRQLEEIN
ncbi:ABC transporter permease subunit [Sanguibacter sp. HDW7]|uniref:ABC transporter permease subunit n=1 Tax=Sanguibacter sp. HDW7 TaxID=2714931 RepID=UPI001407FA4B|nr:ABC transporter permease subunit [Sanguibacter sp. HDW7]QIK83793.1 ABC transporter permease subunit [Sanguibacter sp. HDW7]